MDVTAQEWTQAERTRIQTAAQALREAEGPVRVLRSLAWPGAVREKFLADGRLPAVEYPRFDPAPVVEAVARAKAMLHAGQTVDDWLLRSAQSIEDSAQMLAHAGTPRFLEFSSRVYGTPTAPLSDVSTNALQLAGHLETVLASVASLDLGEPEPACHLASGVADKIRKSTDAHFGEDAPPVEVVDELSANALASPSGIRVRRDACFSDRDVAQLIQHEAFIHVATSLNGRAQSELPILGAGHPGTTRTQEGLAVFAEFITGAMDIDRLGRLVGRVRGIQMAIDGADFVEVVRFFQDRGIEPVQAFENARRVFRGGVIEGGAPFTKDGVYLDGLLRVHNFFRAAVANGRADCLRLVFCGKLDLEDLPALAQLSAAGMLVRPRFLPPWAQDLRFLVAYLAYSTFLSQVDFPSVREHFNELLAEAPRVET